MIDVESPFNRFEDCVLPKSMSGKARIGLATLASFQKLVLDAELVIDQSEDALVFVARGAIKLVAHASQQREQVVAFYFENDLFTVPMRGAHRYSLHSLASTELLIFPYADFVRQCEDEAGVLQRLLTRNALSLQRSREKTIALGRKTASERLASFLVGMAERIGIREGARVLIDLPMSRRDIADSLGLTIETVSRQFSHFRSKGLIETQGRSGVAVGSLEALEQRSGSWRGEP